MDIVNYDAWVLPKIGSPLRRENRSIASLHPQGVLVRVECAMVASYTKKVLDGSTGYTLPELPFVPGTNAVGTVEDIGVEVEHVARGDRVFLSPHLIADESTAEPDQILIGLTAMGPSRFGSIPAGALKLQSLWHDGVFAELAHWPASCVTPIRDLDHIPSCELIALAKLVIPFGGLLRADVRPGDVVAINGASGFFGSAGVMAALAMGASRVVAIGRNAEALADLVQTLGPRVHAATVGGTDTPADTAVIRAAAGGGVDRALDLLGRASSAKTTLATLLSLRRAGRLVLMGSCTEPLAVDFGEMLSNNWEIVGNFMYPKEAPARLVKLLASGQLDLSPLRRQLFPLNELPGAIEAAAAMRSLDLTVVEPCERSC